VVSGVILAAAVLSGVAGALAPVTDATPAWAQQACGPTGGAPPDRLPWPLRHLDMLTVWPVSRGEGVVVAVIDSGVSPTHPVLRDRVLDGVDFGLPSRSGHCDQAGHGTVIAGIIAGRDDTVDTFSGIAPDARILPVRVLEQTGQVTDPSLPGRIAEAIEWAVDNGADVINLSLETVPTERLAEAVRYAVDHDVVLVAAAGNVEQGQERGPAFPAAYEEVLAVAGVDEAGGRVDTSVRGSYIGVAAPGVNIIGPAPRGDGFLTLPEGGTSYAAAYVSGVAALVRSYHPGLSAEQVGRRIMLTADRPPQGRNNVVGYGVVNPYRAVTAVLGTRSNPPVATVEPAPPASDPLAGEKSVAGMAAVVGAVVTGVLLSSRAILRAGRRRGWRPGRPGRQS